MDYMDPDVLCPQADKLNLSLFQTTWVVSDIRES